MRCTITHDPMVDPVITADGHTYERLAIEKWFGSGSIISPATGASLAHQNLVPNIALRSAIHAVFPEACEHFQVSSAEERKQDRLVR